MFWNMKDYNLVFRAAGPAKSVEGAFQLIQFSTQFRIRFWPVALLPILLPDIVFLGHRGINKLLLYKMHISFLSQGFQFCLRVS